ncbi:MAG TPA: RNA 2',3'-cyclic phosphodiesterase [Candidatus Nanoarchaeia archaeon]|nr:RNA 2',3'-cyclic phosphodiesterase [Candidatus Nanoarchaeia archaeon]
MRLFIAIDLPEEAQKALRAAQEQLPDDDNAGLSKVKEFHLTVKFLGEVAEERAEEIKNALTEVIPLSLNASLGKIGVFPDKSAPRVVWVGIEPQKEIIELQRDIDSALTGLFPKEKDYSPHITLARVKTLKTAEELMLSAQKIKIADMTFPIASFSLIKSTLTPEGPIYAVLKKYG